MASETGGREYNLTELFVLKFVLADVLIIAALVLGGPITAVAITALFIASFVFLWYVTRDGDESERRDDRETEAGAESGRAPRDPVTKLQERYAAGELSEAEFEEKLERVIDANERAEEAGLDTGDLELERSR